MKKSIQQIVIACVRAYQWGISPFLPQACRFAPTCSEYTCEALLHYGVFKGTYLAVRRVLRCNPWGGSGVDMVPLPHNNQKKYRA